MAVPTASDTTGERIKVSFNYKIISAGQFTLVTIVERNVYGVIFP